MKTILIALFLVFLSAPSYGALSDNLAACWALGEVSGTRNDSFSTNHLTDNATVTQAVGKVGNAAQFTAASSEYLSIPDNAALSTGNIDWTITLWLYADSLTNFATFINKGWQNVADVNREYIAYVNASKVEFVGGTAAGSQSLVANTFGVLSTATWYFVTLYHDSVGDKLGVSVNAGVANEVAFASGTQDGNRAFEIGASSSQGLHWNGRIDEVTFWKRKLSGAEITTVYNGGTGTSCATIIASGGTPARRSAAPTVFQ
jgi:hypothetical protein